VVAQHSCLEPCLDRSRCCYGMDRGLGGEEGDGRRYDRGRVQERCCDQGHSVQVACLDLADLDRGDWGSSVQGVGLDLGD
jgi:hypothetical protein